MVAKAASCSETKGHAVEGRGALGALEGAQAQLFRVGEVEDVELEDIEQTVHRLGAEAATGVEEIGHVGLLKAGVAGKFQAGQFSTVDAGPDMGAQVVFKV